MTVVSISLPDEILGSLEMIREYLGLKGRSEAVRAAVTIAETEIMELEEMMGDVEGVLIVVHGTHDDQWVNKILHRYEHSIRTHLHSHLQNRKCLEVMILSSEYGQLENMMKDIYGAGKADYIKFVRSR